MAQHAKDERLQTLLGKTGDIMRELGSKVGSQPIGLLWAPMSDKLRS